MQQVGDLVYIEKQLKRSDKQSLTKFDKKYHNLVDYILRITYDIWEKKNIGVLYETYAEDVTLHVGLNTVNGLKGVIANTLETLHVFPDRTLYGEEVIWSHAKGNKYFSSHRIMSSATHLGFCTMYGKPTGKKLFYRVIADCIIKDNRIEEEWLVRDNYHMLQMLGLDPVAVARKNTGYKNSWLQQDRRQLRKDNATGRLAITPTPIPSVGQPVVDRILTLFQQVHKQHYFDTLSTFYHQDAQLHAICDERYSGIAQIKKYYTDIFSSIPQPDIFIDRITCNKGAYLDKIAVRWTISGKHIGYGILDEPSNKPIQLVGITHYELIDGKVQREWTLFDKFDVLCQIHAHTEYDMPLSKDIHKKRILSFFTALNDSSTPLEETIGKYHAEDVTVETSRPFEQTSGVSRHCDTFWKPLFESFSHIEVCPYLVMGGKANGKDYVCAAANLIGLFEHDWLAIPAHRQPVWIRFHVSYLIENDKIAKAWYFIDVLGVIRQAGFNLFTQRGVEFGAPVPMTQDGIITYPTHEADSRKSLTLVDNMLNALGRYDGRHFDSMGNLGMYWDEHDMMWYGPSGIGTTKGLAGFQENHQFPFLKAFPDRGIFDVEAKDSFAALGDGNYACHFGFPAMYGTHKGDGWLGLKATGRPFTMRVMDFWRRENDLLKENWVMIDMVHIFEQFGIDVFDRIKKVKTRHL